MDTEAELHCTYYNVLSLTAYPALPLGGGGGGGGTCVCGGGGEIKKFENKQTSMKTAHNVKRQTNKPKKTPHNPKTDCKQKLQLRPPML